MNYVIQVNNLNFYVIKKKKKNRNRITKIKVLKDIIKNSKNFETLIKEVKTLIQNLLEIKKLNKLTTNYIKQLKCWHKILRKRKQIYYLIRNEELYDRIV